MIRDFSLQDIALLLVSAGWTILLSLIAFVGGSVVGLAIARHEPRRWRRRWLATAISSCFRIRRC